MPRRWGNGVRFCHPLIVRIKVEATERSTVSTPGCLPTLHQPKPSTKRRVPSNKYNWTRLPPLRIRNRKLVRKRYKQEMRAKEMGFLQWG